MIPLLRGEPPAVLAEKAAAWTAKYLEKYDLARGELDLARARVLREFDRALTVILIQRAAAQRATLTDEEVALLRAWADPVRPFSKMIADRLRAAGL